LLKYIKLATLNRVYQLILKNKSQRFWKEMSGSVNVQKNILKHILDRHKSTDFGIKNNFKNITCFEKYQSNVSIQNYESLFPYIQKIMNGEKNILTESEVYMFEKTSGTSSKSKYIPFTKELLTEIHNGTSTWLYDIYQSFPQLLNTSSYWSISPRLGEFETTKGGLPVGLSDESEYFSIIERMFIKELMAVNPGIAKLKVEEFRFHTALDLLKDHYLGLISVWNPSFLILLLEFIEKNKTVLLRSLFDHKQIRRNRLKILENEFSCATINFEKVWPNLAFISTWADGHSRAMIWQLKKRFPSVHIQAKGLLMTEGIVSIPLHQINGSVLSYQSHFYEFLPYEETSDQALLHSELEVGKKYIPIITTSGGLYRYKTNDIIEIQSFYNTLPIFNFLGRCDDTVDYFGEKLNAIHIEKILEEFEKKYIKNCRFKMMAPVMIPHPHYGLFLEGEIDQGLFKEAENYLELQLSQNHHYLLCKKLQQLHNLKIYLVTNALEVYENDQIKNKKQKPGDYKIKVLDSSCDWPTLFHLSSR